MAMEKLIVELRYKDGSHMVATLPRNGMPKADHENLANDVFRKWGNDAETLRTDTLPEIITIHQVCPNSAEMTCLRSFDWEN